MCQVFIYDFYFGYSLIYRTQIQNFNESIYSQFNKRYFVFKPIEKWFYAYKDIHKTRALFRVSVNLAPPCFWGSPGWTIKTFEDEALGVTMHIPLWSTSNLGRWKVSESDLQSKIWRAEFNKLYLCSTIKTFNSPIVQSVTLSYALSAKKNQRKARTFSFCRTYLQNIDQMYPIKWECTCIDLQLTHWSVSCRSDRHLSTILITRLVPIDPEGINKGVPSLNYPQKVKMKSGVCDTKQGLQGVVKKPGVRIVEDGQLRGTRRQCRGLEGLVGKDANHAKGRPRS